MVFTGYYSALSIVFFFSNKSKFFCRRCENRGITELLFNFLLCHMKRSSLRLIIAALFLAIPFALLAYIGKSPESASGTHTDFTFTKANQQNPQPLKVVGKEGITTNFTQLTSAPVGSGTLTNLVISKENGRTRGLIFVRNTPMNVDPPSAVYDFSVPANTRNIYLEVLEESGKIYTATKGSVSVAEKKGKFVTLYFKDLGFENLSQKNATDRFEMNGTLVYSEKDIQTGGSGIFSAKSISKYPIVDSIKTPMPSLFKSLLK